MDIKDIVSIINALKVARINILKINFKNSFNYFINVSDENVKLSRLFIKASAVVLLLTSLTAPIMFSVLPFISTIGSSCFYLKSKMTSKKLRRENVEIDEMVKFTISMLNEEIDCLQLLIDYKNNHKLTDDNIKFINDIYNKYSFDFDNVLPGLKLELNNINDKYNYVDDGNSITFDDILNGLDSVKNKEALLFIKDFIIGNTNTNGLDISPKKK